MKAWLDSECDECFGFGLVPPKEHPLHEDAEFDICPECRGIGRIARPMKSGSFYNVVALAVLAEGLAYRSRRQCQEFIERNYC